MSNGKSTFDRWHDMHQLLLTKERELSDLAIFVAQGVRSVEELDGLSVEVKGLRELTSAMLEAALREMNSRKP